ncbi:hypothetical protein MMC34_007386 [Xylographa carneopallida]|nr:hypothetical protein [Xylographa carneopallida]
MGQSHSKEVRRGSASSQTPLNPGLTVEKIHEVFYSSANPNYADTNAFSDITPPAPPQRLNHMSELIDPYDLLGISAEDNIKAAMNNVAGSTDRNKKLPKLVQSPSGRLLGAQEYIADPRRPLAIRERQESILKAVAAARNGSVGSEGFGCVTTERNRSVATIGSRRAFEQSRVEEGRLAYEKKMKAKTLTVENGRCGCFSGCFGTKD